MLEEVGIPKIISDQFLIRIPFLKDLVWDPRACGVGEQEKSLFHAASRCKLPKPKTGRHSFWSYCPHRRRSEA